MTESFLRDSGRAILALTGLGTLLVPFIWGIAPMLFFLAGGLAGYYGFRVHVAMVDRALLGKKRRGLLPKALLRYGLIIAGCCVIVLTQRTSLPAFLVGLMMPTAGVMISSLRQLSRSQRGR